ncbi:hypothetical protein K438DRAFT_1768041 [Mycena galopus ATCC 62051]|nr:hypothetical protein K438DRAFT_1768041 [Mycena galopus ATCC 62051]
MPTQGKRPSDEERRCATGCLTSTGQRAIKYGDDCSCIDPRRRPDPCTKHAESRRYARAMDRKLPPPVPSLHSMPLDEYVQLPFELHATRVFQPAYRDGPLTQTFDLWCCPISLSQPNPFKPPPICGMTIDLRQILNDLVWRSRHSESSLVLMETKLSSAFNEAICSHMNSFGLDFDPHLFSFNTVLSFFIHMVTGMPGGPYEWLKTTEINQMLELLDDDEML